MKILSLDFGGSSVKYGLVDTETAEITCTGKVPAPLASEKEFVDSVAGIYSKFHGQTAGIGISLPGNVNPNTGDLLGNGVYTELYGKNIPNVLKDVCDLPVYVENDGKCGALSEAWKGGLSDVKDGAVIILGSGIAGGLIKDGKIHGGKGFNAGELSYMITNADDYSMFAIAFMNCAALGITYKLCKLKNLDLNVQDSAPSMYLFESLYANRYPKMEGPKKQVRADGKQFFAWVDKGDAEALQVYQECIKSLAVLIFNVQVCYAPEKIVIGGGLSAYPKLLDDTRAELERMYAPFGMIDNMRSELVRSFYTDECNLIGAAYNVMLRADIR